MTQARGADPHRHAACGYWLEAVEVGSHLEVSAMEDATAGVGSAKTPANSGEVLGDGETMTRTGTTRRRRWCGRRVSTTSVSTTRSGRRCGEVRRVAVVVRVDAAVRQIDRGQVQWMRKKE